MTTEDALLSPHCSGTQLSLQVSRKAGVVESLSKAQARRTVSDLRDSLRISSSCYADCAATSSETVLFHAHHAFRKDFARDRRTRRRSSAIEHGGLAQGVDDTGHGRIGARDGSAICSFQRRLSEHDNFLQVVDCLNIRGVQTRRCISTAISTASREPELSTCVCMNLSIDKSYSLVQICVAKFPNLTIALQPEREGVYQFNLAVKSQEQEAHCGMHITTPSASDHHGMRKSCLLLMPLQAVMQTSPIGLSFLTGFKLDSELLSSLRRTSRANHHRIRQLLYDFAIEDEDAGDLPARALETS